MSLRPDLEKLEEFIANYPIYEYRIIKTQDIILRGQVRTICRQECERYGTTWACPPAVGNLFQCADRINEYDFGVFFSSVAEVTDVLNFDETLATRDDHEELTSILAGWLEEQGFETFTLSTESCAICEKCTYPEGKPCRFPKRMHPCLESHGVVVNEIVEKEEMEYNLGGNTILWFSMILIRKK